MPDGIKISQLTTFPGKRFADVVPFSGGDPFASYAFTLQTLLNLGVTGLTGGGSGNLDGTPTAEEAELQIWNVVTTGNLLSPYQLQTSTAAQSSPNIIRPLDFDAGNNPKVFQLLGYKGLSLTLTGTAGAGFVEMLAQSGAPATPSGAARIYADASSRPSWVQPDGFTRTFSSTLTDSRVYTLPDTSGTIALTASSLPSVAGTAGQVLVNGATAAVTGTAITLSLATALTSINSVTASTTTDLTLNGGSSGASLLLAQSSTASVTLTAKGQTAQFFVYQDSTLTARAQYGPYGSSSTGTGNTSFGVNALSALTLGTNAYNNAAFGANAGASNTSGYQNVFVGSSAASSNTTGFQNTAVGQGSAYNTTTSSKNTTLGFHSNLSNVGTDGENTALGHSAMSGASGATGGYNTAVGAGAMSSFTTATENVSLGRSSLSTMTTGARNVAAGVNVGLSLTTGSDNILFGWRAGYTQSAANALTTGAQNIYIGTESGASVVSATAVTNSIAIGYRALVAASNSATWGNSSITAHSFPGGTVSIASTTASTTTATGALVVGGGVGVGSSIWFGTTLNTTSASLFPVVLAGTNAAGTGIDFNGTGTGARNWQLFSTANGAGVGGGRLAIYDNTRGAYVVSFDASGNQINVATTVSSSTATGALVVGGGVGIAGAIVCGGAISAGQLVLTSTATDNNIYLRANGAGFVRVDTGGGFRVENGLFTVTTNGTHSFSSASSILSLSGTTTSTSTTTGSLINAGGFGNAGNINVGGNVVVANNSSYQGRDTSGNVRNLVQLDSGNVLLVTNAAGNIVLVPATSGRIRLQNAAQSVNTFEVVDGTVSTATVNINATTASSSTTTGALIVGGGVGIAGATYIGGFLQNVGAVRFAHGASISSTAWGVAGVAMNVGSSGTYTDTSSSGTVATAVAVSLTGPTFAASSSTTFSDAANLYVVGMNTGTNVTFSRNYAIWATGAIRSNVALWMASTNTNSNQGIIWGAPGSEDAYLYRSAAGTLNMSATTASASTTTGALVVGGGVGIAGATYIGGGISVGAGVLIIRLTNAGSDVGVSSMVSASAGVGGIAVYSAASESSHSYTTYNGTRQIAVASVGTASVTTTAGAETADLVFKTKPAGSALLTRMTIAGADGAITLGTASSITAAASTNLTLSGGSSGASLALATSTTGGATLTVGSATSPAFTISGAASPLVRTTSSGGARQGFEAYISSSLRAEWTVNAGTGEVRMGGVSTGGYFPTFYYNAAEGARISTTGNLLVGTTTDASSLAGGLVLNGSGSGATASSTTTGTLRVTGGAGISGAAYIGGGMSVAGGIFTASTTSTNYATFTTAATAGVAGGVLINSAAANTIRFAPEVLGGANPGLWFNDAGSPSSSNYAMLGTASTTLLNAGTTLTLRVANGTKLSFVAATATFDSTTTVAVANTTVSSSTTTGALVVSGGVGVAGQVTATTGSFGATQHSNSAVLFSYGVLKVGGSAAQGTGVIALGDDQTSVQNVGIWRSSANGATSGTGNQLNIGGYTGITFTTGAAALGSQTTAGTIDASQNWTLTGDLTVTGGNVGVGGAATAAYNLYLQGTSTTGTQQGNLLCGSVFSSAATTFGRCIFAGIATAAASFTMTNGRVLDVTAPVVGAASAITTLQGIYVDNQGATGITNVYGIDIAAQSGAASVNIGLRNAGTTQLTGNVGIGTSPGTDRMLVLQGTTTAGADQFGLVALQTFSSAATSSGTTAYLRVATTAAAYTMTSGVALQLVTPSLGAASAITTSTGISIQSMGVSGVTNAYGIDIAAQSGAATTNVGLRNLGSTLLATGITLCHTTATPAAGSTSARVLLGTTAGFGIYYGSGAPTVSAAQGSFYIRSDGTGTGDRAYINSNGSTGWVALTTAS